jgi:DNA-binding GntR family transcriptional regulator
MTLARVLSVTRAAMPIRVDRSSPVPLYFQVAQHLEHMIESGELPMGTRLENETDLAGQLGLSRPTMRRAIEYLVGRGLLIRKRGIGTQVVQTKVTREVELTSLYDDLAKTGRTPATTVVSFRTEAADEALAATLGMAAGTPVYVIERLRYADAEPLALMRNHVPEHLLRLTAADLEEQGLYNLLRANGVTMRIAKQAIGARAATPAEARALGEKRGTPLLTMERSAYDEQGRAVEHGHHLFRASRYSFDLTLTGW